MISTAQFERRLRAQEKMNVAPGRQFPDDPVEFARWVGFEPDPWQFSVLAGEHPRRILCCGRQTGKSTVATILALHRALHRSGSTTLIVAPGERQAKLLFAKCMRMYRQLGIGNAISERRTGLELPNGSLIEALPAVERTVRGYSVDLLVVDEAAAVLDEDYYGILPALIATGGDQILLSTPRGKRGFFYETWMSSGRSWHKSMVRSDEVARISSSELEALRSAMPEPLFRQEFACEFLDIEGGMFARDDIDAALEAGLSVEALEDDEW